MLVVFGTLTNGVERWMRAVKHKVLLIVHAITVATARMFRMGGKRRVFGSVTAMSYPVIEYKGPAGGVPERFSTSSR